MSETTENDKTNIANNPHTHSPREEWENQVGHFGGDISLGEKKSLDGHLRSRVVKRSLVVGGHKTSVSLEDAFWMELRGIAQKLDVHLSQLVGTIDSERQHNNLSSAIRLFVFEYRTNSHNPDGLSPGIRSVLDGVRKRNGAT